MSDLMELFHDVSPYEGHDLAAHPPDLQGWGSTDQIFEAAIAAVRPNIIVEVGTWKGASAIHMARVAQRLGLPTQIICVDTWLGSPEHFGRADWRSSLRLRNGYPQLYFTFLSNVIGQGLTDRIIPLPATSENAAEILTVKGIRPDLIYIDAAHSYEPVLRDLRLYWRLLSDNGILLGDDYLLWPEVTRAADDFAVEIGVRLVGKRGKFTISKNPRLQPVAQTPEAAAATMFAQAQALYQQGQLEQAEALCRAILEQTPDHAAALQLRGDALSGLKRYEEALASYDRALTVTPDSADVFYNRGNALRGLHRHEEALASYDRALAVRPDYVEALNNHGNALRSLQRHEEALASYERALTVTPDYAVALYNRGNALHDLGRYEQAAYAFERLLAMQPNFDYVRGNLLTSKLISCDWQDYDDHVAATVADVVAGKRAADPTLFVTVCESPGALRKCAETFNRHKYPSSDENLSKGERYHHGRIRIAYLTPDFYDHPTAHLMAGLFEAHDRSRFETFAISFGPDSDEGIGLRVKKSFDHFIDIGNKSDRDAALLLRELEIDIVIDLVGPRNYCRAGIFAFRPAPIQVNYLGFPGTTGAEYIDYILADRFVIPESQQAFYSEKVVYLPDTYQANDRKRRISVRTPGRRECGLPDTGFVFCSFSGNYKIAPLVFDVWMRLLDRVENSVLWLLEGGAAAVRNLRQRAQAKGIAAERLVFAPRIKLEDHLARHRLAGLLLDTLPYNAHTTASDALWAGLPVVTCAGTSFAGRVAGSLLRAVGLPELITDNLDAYEALALKLALDQDLLAATKAKLARHRESFPLFDTDRFCRHIERAYQTMWERHQHGEPPAAFAVEPVTPSAS